MWPLAPPLTPPPPLPSRLLQDIYNVRTGQEHITQSEKLLYKAYLTIIPRARMGSEQERIKRKEKASPNSIGNSSRVIFKTTDPKGD